MKYAATILSMLVTTAVLAGDCPVPKPPTCAERIERAKKAGCNLDCVCPACPNATASAVATCPPATPAETKIVYQDVYRDVPVFIPEQEKGHALLGGGPVYFHGLGLTAVGGYQFKPFRNGGALQILAGPMYVPQNGTAPVNGTVTNCHGNSRNDHDSHCATLPYNVPGQDAKSALGGQALVIYAF